MLVLMKRLSKSYTTENAYRSHINSKRHREAETKYNEKLKKEMDAAEGEEKVVDAPVNTEPTSAKTEATPNKSNNASQEDVEMTIEEKIARARTRLSPNDCLFCPVHSDSLADNLTHMSITHGFFVPDAEYLVDLAGLITYLGEKIAVGNVCIYCYGRKRHHANAKGRSNKEEANEESDVGREFRSLEATRRHMIDKAHCKIAYETEDERLEISDYYDFTSSYPSASKRKQKKEKDAEWEDVDGEDNEDADEVVEEEASEDESMGEDSGIRFGDSPFELVLPSGARIGHRSLRHYYKQNHRTALKPESPSEEDPKSGVALVRQLLNQKNSALVPRKGGFGEFGQGGEVVKARNPGEAKEAGRHVKEFRDVKRREDFKTKVAFIANNQKHYRDPLLQ
jgi:pre-60S factor REI1